MPRAAPPAEANVAAPAGDAATALAATAPAALEPDAAGVVSAALASICLVETAETRRVGVASDVAGALALLASALDSVADAPPPFGSGVLRLEAALPRGTDALDWLRSLPPQARAHPRAHAALRMR